MQRPALARGKGRQSRCGRRQAPLQRQHGRPGRHHLAGIEVDAFDPPAHWRQDRPIRQIGPRLVGIGPFGERIDGKRQTLRHSLAKIEGGAFVLDLVAIIGFEFDFFGFGRRALVFFHKAQVHRLVDLHGEILDAIEQRDSERAKRLSRTLIES